MCTTIINIIKENAQSIKDSLPIAKSYGTKLYPTINTIKHMNGGWRLKTPNTGQTKGFVNFIQAPHQLDPLNRVVLLNENSIDLIKSIQSPLTQLRIQHDPITFSKRFKPFKYCSDCHVEIVKATLQCKLQQY